MKDNELLNKIKEFFVENKKNMKYIVAGAVLVVVIVIFLVLLVSGGNKKSNKNTETSVENFEFSSEFSEENNDEIAKLIEDYYKAYVSNDIKALEKVASPITENEKNYIAVLSNYYEEFSDIKIHVKDGLKEGSYFVSAEKSVKLYDVETTAPALDFFYVESDDKGVLYINNAYCSFNLKYNEIAQNEDVIKLIEKYTSSDDFIKLYESVSKKYEEVLAGDKELSAVMNDKLAPAVNKWHSEEWIEPKTESKDETKDNTEKEEKKDQSTESTEKDDKKDQSTEKEDKKDDDKKTDDKKTDDKKDDDKKEGASSQTENQPQEQQPQAPAEYKVMTLDVVNVRDGASTSSNVLGMLKENTQLTAYGTEGEWTIISYSAGVNGRAYIKTSNLKNVN